MNRLEVQMCLIDHEINELVSKKNLIDIRLNELYVERENLVTEYYNQEAIVRRDDNIIGKMTRKEAEELIKGVKDGDL